MSREAFEKWYAHQPRRVCYSEACKELNWTGWQAAAEHYEAVTRRAVEIAALEAGRCMCGGCSPNSFFDDIIARAKGGGSK